MSDDEKLIGKTIVWAQIGGYGVRLKFSDGSILDYTSSDGGYSCWDIIDSTKQAEMNQHELCKYTNNMGEDTISRQAAIDALWKALYDYENKTEKQFIESEDLDVADWIQHRNFVQNMSDIDRRTILDLPSLERRGRWEHLGGDEWFCTACAHVITTEGSWERPWQKYCEECGAKMREVSQ